MRFSERIGIKPTDNIIQYESMNEALKIGLWNLLDIYCWRTVNPSPIGRTYLDSPSNKHLRNLCEKVWFKYFKWPLDTLDNNWRITLNELRKYHFESDWSETYDFIEFIANTHQTPKFLNKFTSACNVLFEEERGGYRFVDGLVVPITNPEEINTIKEAANTNILVVQEHLNQALKLLGDRDAPDYRNSMKESISAVESLVRQKLNDEKGTLGALLQRLQNEHGIHKALSKSFTQLYGYTSDADGIRHALSDVAQVDSMMRNTCS